MKKVLSVVIPTYNMENYLRKCLDSLIVSDENMAKLEVLVINDGSKDSSSQIGHEYETKYPQTFRVIDKENGNYGSCINRGLKEATGKYVKVLDADDYFDAQIFNAYINYLQTIDVDLIISDYCIVDPNGIVQESYTFPLPTKGIFSLRQLSIETVMWLWHHGITYKREILIQMDYHQTEGISYTDDEWIFKPMTQVRQVSYYPYCLYYYLMGREGQTFDPKILNRDFDKRFVVLRSMLSYYSDVKSVISKDVDNYLKYKLYDRLIPVYRYFLIQNSTKNGNFQLMEIDKSVRHLSSELTILLDQMENKLGWKYVQDWVNSGYNRYHPHLIILRIKHRIFCMLGLYKRNLHMKDEFKRKDNL